MNYQEQLAKINATIKAKHAQIGDIMTKSVSNGHTPSDDDENTITKLETDIARLEKSAERLQKLIKSVETATPSLTEVAGENPKQAAASADGVPDPKKTTNVQVVKSLPKGIGFAQMAKAKALSARLAKQGSYVAPAEIAVSMGMHPDVVLELQKSAQVLDTSNSKPLVPVSHFMGDFIELLRAKTIVDRLAARMRHVPFNITISGQATGAAASWVGEGAAKPVSNPTFNTIEIKQHKLAGICVLTDELLRNSTFAADNLVLSDLLESTTHLIDTTFVDDQAQSATRPGGILHGATKHESTGNEATQIRADLLKLRQEFIKKNLSLDGAEYLMTETRISEWAELRNPLGAPEFPGLQAGFGQRTLDGLPVIESENVGNNVILVKPSELYLADDGMADVSYSDQATVMIDSTAFNLWQQNKFAIRAERYITWTKRRAIAAAYIHYS